jgi:endonuclease/exonuclease/phosphatase family metal-dependent hydrolase
MHAPLHETVDAIAWNIHRGGFSTYDHSEYLPPDIDLIKEQIEIFHHDGVQAVSLTDAYRWGEIFGDQAEDTDQDIAEYLGFADARFMLIEDERLDRENGIGSGLVFASDVPIDHALELDLGTRKALGIIYDIGRAGLQIATVYLDDMSETLRMQQYDALLRGLQPDMPTFLLGDFNSLRPTMRRATLGTKAGDAVVRATANLTLPQTTYGRALRGRNARLLIPHIEASGFTDADAKLKRPTFPKALPIFGLDYAFHNSQASIRNFEVVEKSIGSDHRPLRMTLRTPAARAKV